MSKNKQIYPVGFSDPRDYKRLHRRLQALNYHKKGIADLLKRSELAVPDSADLPLLLHRTRGGSPLETLVRLFFIGVPVAGDMAERALGPVPLERCAAAGLITLDNDEVIGNLHLQPYRDLIFAHDSLQILKDGGREDWVMGIGNSTMMLVNLAIRQKVGNMLDLCSGCGCHALLAAEHSDRIVAVDRNPRATGYCSFNTQLNLIENVDSLTGNLFEPVVGQRFGLIVSNPPFVISPSSKFIYRDGGLRGDEFCRRLLREAPEYLEEGGYLFMLFNFAHYKGQNWKERLPQWFEGIGCDVWVLYTKTRDISDYAATWIKTTEGIDVDRFTNAYKQWIDYYEQETIEAISDCTLIMRRNSSGPNWFSITDSPENITGAAGEDIIRTFLVRDFLESVSNETLLNAKLKVAESVGMRQEFQATNGGWNGEPAELYREKGLTYKCKVDMYVAGFVARCNGKRTVRELLKELAEVIESDFDTLVSKSMAFIRQLIEQGFLYSEGVGD